MNASLSRPLAGLLLLAALALARPGQARIDLGDAHEGGTPVRLAQAEGEVPTTAPKNCKKRTGKFHFQFEEAGIFDVLKQISLLTCKNFIVSEGVKSGKKELTIISRTPVTTDGAYSAFLSALEANNMALVPAGQFLKVVERKDAAKQALPMYEKRSDGSVAPVETGDTITYNDAHVTLLYELRFAAKDAVQALVRNMLGKSGDLQVIGNNLLIITDSASNVRRIMTIIDRIDVAGAGNRIHIVDIEFAEAQGISGKLTEIFGQASVRGGAKPAPKREAKGDGEGGASEDVEDVSIEKIVADERTNKLIIIASEKAFAHIKELIDVLDVPSELASTGSQIYVHPLNNADAQKVSSTLSSLAQGSAQKNQAAQKGKKDAAKGNEPAALFEGEVKVTADESTNALVITSSARDYRALKKVIEQLDIRRPQVFVEAAILEVSLTQNRSFSIDAYSGLPITVPGFEGAGLGFIANEGGQNLISSSAQLLAAQALFQRLQATPGGLDAATASTALESATALESLLGWASFTGPPVPGSQELFGFPVPSFGMVLNALQNNSNVDVLSTPHIMTTDNEKAEISVGKRVPVVRGISNLGGAAGSALGFGALQQVAYEDVKLKFTVTPHVNVDDEIRLEVEQEVSDLGENIPVGNGLTQPVITSRTAKTTIVVRDQQTMVIGGLIGTRKNDTERKFPILGDVPIIGWLFKTWSDGDQKTNLILVLTPYIVRERGDFEKIYERKMTERKEFIEAFYGTASDYNPYIDYDKKSGPLAKLNSTLDDELLKAENGGPGLPGELIITPESAVTPFDVDATTDGAGDAPADGADATTDAPADGADASDAPAEGGEPAADADAPADEPAADDRGGEE